MNQFKMYRKRTTQQMRKYIPGEDLSKVSVSAEDTPADGGMIAVSADNPNDQWYVAGEFFLANYDEV